MGWVVSKHDNNNSCAVELQSPHFKINQTFLKTAEEDVITDTLADLEIDYRHRESVKVSSNELNILTIDHDDYEDHHEKLIKSFTNLEGSFNSLRSDSWQKPLTKSETPLEGSSKLARVLNTSQRSKLKEISIKPQVKIKHRCTDLPKLNRNVQSVRECKEAHRVPFVDSRINRNKSFPPPSSHIFPKKVTKFKRLPPIPIATLDDTKNTVKKSREIKDSKKTKENHTKTQSNIHCTKEDTRPKSTRVNLSPLKVEDGEKEICSNKSVELTKSLSCLLANRNIKTNKRPKSAEMAGRKGRTDKTEEMDGFNNILADFNRKLEKLMKDNHVMNNYCTNCNHDCDNESKTAAGRITFFFVKKYGNIGKFLLARLNEFLDNAYKGNRCYSHINNLKNDFPLPCNAGDIGFSGELKPNYLFPKDARVINRQSRLPRLIARKETSKIICDSIESVTESQNNNNKSEGNMNLQCSSKEKCKNKKVVDTQSTEVSGTMVPPSCVVPRVRSGTPLSYLNFERKNDLTPFSVDTENKTLDLEKMYEAVSGKGDGGSLALHNPTENGSIKLENGSNSNSISSYNEEDVNTLANKIIDDLWLRNFAYDCADMPTTRN